MQNKIAIRFEYTKNNDSVEYKNKITFNHFLKMVWTASRTNLHYADFKASFEGVLRQIYNPCKIETSDIVGEKGERIKALMAEMHHMIDPRTARLMIEQKERNEKYDPKMAAEEQKRLFDMIESKENKGGE